MRRLYPLLIVLLAAACASADEARRPDPAGVMAGERGEPTRQMLADAAASFEEVVEPFLEWYYQAHPVRATELGVDAHDDALPALDRRSVQGRIDALLQWEARLQAVPAELLRGTDRLDHAVLASGIRAELLDLEEIRRWAADPRLYTAVIARGLESLIESGAGPPEGRRARAVVARMLAAPAILAAARENLESPPRLWTELAIEDTESLMDYVSAIPGSDGGLEGARGELLEALAGHSDWLEGTLLPRSTGDFRLGRYLFLRQLRNEEHVDLSVDELSRLNQEAVAQLREELVRAAAAVDEDRSPRAIVDSLGSDPVLSAARSDPDSAWQQQVEREVRRVFMPRSLTDGWDHYREQLVLDSLAEGDPAVELVRVKRALLHHARWFAALQLHASGASVDEVVDRFMEIAYVDREDALQEVVRATHDPLYLSGALGRMQIEELRRDYAAHVRDGGGAFSPSDFQERLLTLGLPPTLAREVLIPLP